MISHTPNACNASRLRTSKNHRVLFRNRDGLPLGADVARGVLRLELADKVDNDVVLLDPEVVEVFADGQREALLALAGGLASDHGRGVHADALGLREDGLVEGPREGAWGVEVVLSAVGVEGLSVEGGPLNL